MPIRRLLEQSKKLEIEAYKKPRDLKELGKTHVPFSGSPSIHPHDPKLVILVPDPYSTSPFYYEFKSKDIAFVEKLPSIVGLDGGTFNMARLWVKKSSVGLICTPFRVEETRGR